MPPKRSRRQRPRLQYPGSADLGFPASRLVKMRYSSYADFAGVSGTLGTQIVGCGDLFDPDKTGGGHQPLGFDQWATFYSYYVVLRSKIVATFMYNQAQAADTQPVVGIYRDNNTTVSAASVYTLIEQGRGVHAVLAPSMSTPVTTLSLDYDVRREFAIKDVSPVLDVGAVFTASPADAMYFILWAGGRDESTTSASAVVYVVEYDVLISQRKELASS